MGASPLLLRPTRPGAIPGFAARLGEARGLSPTEMLVGTGEAPDWREVGAACVAAAGLHNDLRLDATDTDAAALLLGARLRAWRFEALKSARRDQRVALAAPLPKPARARLDALLAGVDWARDAVSQPGNLLTPERFAQRLLTLRRDGLEVEVIAGQALRDLGAAGLLAVGGGSASPPCLVVLRWPGRLAQAPVAFVGKGICFDTGGISIKPAGGMAAMRADMAGAAACAGAMRALARRNSPAPAIAVLALAENATGHRSYRPGDVLRLATGTTVEVLDTDAEGRLVLADALHLAIQRHLPQAVIDLATLTGSVVMALGHHRAGLFGNDTALMDALSAAGDATGELLWPLPIGQRHREDLTSDIADLRQCAPHGSGAFGGRLLPDASHAAAFLREFVGQTPWAHLDIAAMDTAEPGDKLYEKGQATGFGVRLLDALMAERFEA